MLEKTILQLDKMSYNISDFFLANGLCLGSIPSEIPIELFGGLDGP